jgi:hypothetical protein
MPCPIFITGILEFFTRLNGIIQCFVEIIQVSDCKLYILLV